MNVIANNNKKNARSDKFYRANTLKSLTSALLTGLLICGLTSAVIAAGTHNLNQPAYSESAIQPMPEMPQMRAYQQSTQSFEEVDDLTMAVVGIDPIITGPVPTPVNIK